MKKQISVYYSGRVQGVGFRFTAENLANKLGISGWVKNLNDGRVEILAEAEEDALKKFLSELGESFSRYIQNTEINWLDPLEKFQDFSIKF